MMPEKKLSEYLGRHEKTKAVVKLQKKGQGAPAREPVVDQETQKAMMAWYYKKQEEQKVGLGCGEGWGGAGQQSTMFVGLFRWLRCMCQVAVKEHWARAMYAASRQLPKPHSHGCCCNLQQPSHSSWAMHKQLHDMAARGSCRSWPRMRMTRTPTPSGPATTHSKHTFQASALCASPGDGRTSRYKSGSRAFHGDGMRRGTFVEGSLRACMEHSYAGAWLCWKGCEDREDMFMDAQQVTTELCALGWVQDDGPL